MPAYSTTKPREDGPIPSNPEGTRPISPLGVTLSGLKGWTLRRPSKLARNEMDHAGAAIVIVHRPYTHGQLELRSPNVLPWAKRVRANGASSATGSPLVRCCASSLPTPIIL